MAVGSAIGAIPPEGGWGWMVAIAMAVMFTVTSGPLGSFGLLFGDFLTSLGEGTQAVTAITSVFFTCLSFTGLITNYALNSYSCRQVGIFGSILFCLGSSLTVFSTSVMYMVICYGVVQGIGMGLMVPATFSSFNTYFLHKRTFAMSIGQVIIGATMVLFPLLIQDMVARFGFRGAQAISTAISMNSIVAMAMLRPVQNLKAPVKDEKEGDELRDKIINTKREGKKTLYLDVEDKRLSYQKMEGAVVMESDADNIILPEVEASDFPNYASASLELSKGEHQDGLKPEIDNLITGRRLNLNPRPSLASVKSWALPGSLNLTSRQDSLKRKIGKKSVSQGIVDFLDLTLLKDPVYVSIVMGISFAFYADITFFTIFPMIMFDLDFSNNDTAYCMAVGSAGDLVGRVFIACLGLVCPSIASRTVFFWGVVLSIISRTAFISFSNFTTLCVMTGLLGFFRSWIMVPAPLVFADHCKAERFPSAYGLYMVINGLVAIVAGPIIGFIRDYTSSFPICVHSLNVMAMICVVLWVAEGIAVKFKSK